MLQKEEKTYLKQFLKLLAILKKNWLLHIVGLRRITFDPHFMSGFGTDNPNPNTKSNPHNNPNNPNPNPNNPNPNPFNPLT